MRARVSVTPGDEIKRSMRTPSFGLALAFALSGCSAGVGPSDFDLSRANDAAAACAPAGPAPQFALAGVDTAGTRVLVTASGAGGSAFAAFVQLQHAGDPPITGGELRPVGTSGASYAAAIPALRAGVAYTVTALGMQDTNRAPECQKSFALTLGSLTAR